MTLPIVTESEARKAWNTKYNDKQDRKGADLNKYRGYSLKTRYGITLAEYDAMLAYQNGRCAICLQPPAGGPKCQFLDVDHDHKTGRVRGLLCSTCNHVLGRWKDNTRTILRAARYLLEHQ